MEQTTTEPQAPAGVERWALLIGINYWPDGPFREFDIGELKGCVADVEAIEQYLKAINVPETNIVKLTATRGLGDALTELPSIWPTRDNIIGELDNIIRKVKRGDLVYIHYSGHGLLRKYLPGPLDDGGGNNFTGVALVPMDVKLGGAYLSAYQLGVRIRSLAEGKGARVTLVLDCCYSGRGIRGGGHVDTGEATIRGIDAPVEEPMLESDVAADEEAQQLQGYDENGVLVDPISWLSKPKSCTILTACDASQVAGETSTAQGCRGNLTYWMLDCLYRAGLTSPPSYRSLRNQLERRMAAWKHIQTPMLHGDPSYEFFGHRQFSWQPSSLVSHKDGSYILEVGHAQGVAVGARYELHPDDWEASLEEAAGTPAAALQLRISKAFHLSSEAEPVQEQDRAAINQKLALGYRAFLRRWALPSRMAIKVVGSSTTLESQYLDSVRARLRKELSATHSVDAELPSGNASGWGFQLSVDEQRKVVIQDAGGARIPHLPTLVLSDAGAMEKLVDILKHVSRFHAIKELDYGKPCRDKCLPKSRFLFAAYDEDHELLRKNASGHFIAKDGQIVRVEFTIQEGSEPVFVTFFQLTDKFGIAQMLPDPGQRLYEVHKDDPEPALLCVRALVPRDDGVDALEAKEIMRAYVYSPWTHDKDRRLHYAYRGSRMPLWCELEMEEVLQPREPKVTGNPDEDKSERGSERNHLEDGRWLVMDFTLVTLA